MKHDVTFRLTEQQIADIIKRLAKGESIRSIATVYEVNFTTIWKIRKKSQKSRWKPSET